MKFKALLLLVLLALILPSSQPIAAQTAKPGCDPAALLAAMSALKSSGDNTKDWQTLQAISAAISNMNVICNGLVFKGKGNKVLDPFILPAGTYRLTVKTKQAFIASGRTMEGAGSECAPNKEFTMLNEVNLEGDKIIDSSTVVPTSNCRILITTSNSSDDWTLTFELIQ
jgi:hypothetical protein